MRAALLAVLVLSGCGDETTIINQASAASGEASAGPGGADGAGGDGVGGVAVTVASGVTSTASTAAAGTGGNDEGGGGQAATTASSSSSGSGGDDGTGGTGGGGCPAAPCADDTGTTCDPACSDVEPDLLCEPRVCELYEVYDTTPSTTIRTPPIDGHAPGCSTVCDGALSWFIRIEVKAGECVKATGPIGSAVYLENPNLTEPTCFFVDTAGCTTQTNQWDEDTALVLGIPAGMTTAGALFTITPCDGVTECEPAGCNGAGER